MGYTSRFIMGKPDTSMILLIIAVSVVSQLGAITGIFYVVNKDAWAWLIVPGGAYVGLRYLEEHARETLKEVRKWED